ncbi:hypothetical protein H4R35_003350 [Dimargaris xerosporica]|nr:hypothetical protein H4R35_003350 [Dimargaris xerosporica]
MGATTTGKAQEKPLNSLLAGALAGAVEATLTYPTEYVKTQMQLQGAIKPGGAVNAAQSRLVFTGPVDCVVKTVRHQGVSALYRGLSAMIIGTASKAGVRFLSYDYFKAKLADDQGQVKGMRSLMAGLAAGMTEAVLVVTPTEAIKTKLIQDQNSVKPQYRGLVHGVTNIVRQHGVAGIYSGLFPVMLRQGANAAVRFSAYNFLKQQIIRYNYEQDAVAIDPVTGQAKVVTLPWTTTFLIGMVAGTITVYATMPIDVLKTKMQSVNAKSLYRNSFHCIWRVFHEEGITAFWRGATPRLSRLMFSGGIVFSVYEQAIKVLRVIN